MNVILAELGIADGENDKIYWSVKPVATALQVTLPPVRSLRIRRLEASDPDDDGTLPLKPLQTVIDHCPVSTGLYIGSPTMCILPNGDYVATHDLFGPAGNEYANPTHVIFRSSDKGVTWQEISRVGEWFWGRIFVLNGVLYGIGNQYGTNDNMLIRKSTDGGYTWTKPTDSKNGVLFTGLCEMQTNDVLIHNGRIWKAFMTVSTSPSTWPQKYCATVMSAPVYADLLNADSWTFSNYLPYDKNYLNGRFTGWLEATPVVDPNGRLLLPHRVHFWPGYDERAAYVEVIDPKTITLDPVTGFVPFPGAGSLFQIKYDPVSKRYWSLSNIITKEFIPAIDKYGIGWVRNTVGLMSSADMQTWTVHKIVLQGHNAEKHGFQYNDFIIEGNDMIFVSRVGYDDEEGGADNYHNANFFCFYRIKNFRKYQSESMDDDIMK
jgi:hypothetical protein